jgi:hypothetical protein
VLPSRRQILDLARRDAHDDVGTVDEGLESSLCCPDLMERRDEERKGAGEGKEVDSEGDALKNGPIEETEVSEQKRKRRGEENAQSNGISLRPADGSEDSDPEDGADRYEVHTVAESVEESSERCVVKRSVCEKRERKGRRTNPVRGARTITGT